MQAYITNEDSSCDKSSEYNDDSEKDTDALVEVSQVSKISIPKAISGNGLQVPILRHICLTNLYYSGPLNES
jgi:hypothetical protein